MNHVFICIRALLYYLNVEFHILQGKPGIMDNKIQFFLLVLRVWKGEETLHPNIDNVLMGFILLGPDRGFRISFPGNDNNLTDNVYFEHVSYVLSST